MQKDEGDNSSIPTRCYMDLGYNNESEWTNCMNRRTLYTTHTSETPSPPLLSLCRLRRQGRRSRALRRRNRPRRPRALRRDKTARGGQATRRKRPEPGRTSRNETALLATRPHFSSRNETAPHDGDRDENRDTKRTQKTLSPPRICASRKCVTRHLTQNEHKKRSHRLESASHENASRDICRIQRSWSPTGGLSGTLCPRELGRVT